MRILRGERPRGTFLTGTEMNRYMFDSRQLRRWGIREQTLPEGSQIVYREPSLWKEYCAYIVTGAAAILLQSLLIAVLLLNRKKQLQDGENALADRLRFETMLADLSSHFVDITPETVHREIQGAIARVAPLDLDRGTVFEVSDDGTELRASVSWVRSRPGSCAHRHSRRVGPLAMGHLNRGDVFQFSSVEELPDDAAHEKELHGAARIEGGRRGPPEGQRNNAWDACVQPIDPRTLPGTT